MKKTIILLITMATQILTGAPSLSPDRELASETLSNGMTIAVYRNVEPPNRVAMRLLVKRGSAYETDSERGLAHFIEHMAFNGTKHFPAGQMVEYFQRLGMAFGADTNAHTGFTETVYKLDMPEVSQKLIDDGLLLLRDYSDSIEFAPEAIEKERGVIIAEKNSRDSQDYRKAVKEIEHYFKGSIFSKRMPIGEKSLIESAKQSDFKKFYNANYRPENTVLVIVGDVDAKKTLAEAKKYFEDFKASDSEPARAANMGSLEAANFKFEFDAKEIPIDVIYDSTSNSPKSYASISVSKELKNRPDDLEKRVEDYRLNALSNAITARYLRVASSSGSKITQGSGGNFEFDNYCRVMMFSSDAPVSKASDALEENFRQLMSFHNLSDAELDNAKKKIIESLESQVKGKSTRTNRELADELTTSYSQGAVFTTPELDLEIAKYAFENFDAKQAVALFKKMLDGSKFKVFVSDTTAEIPQNELEALAQKSFGLARKSTYDASRFSTEELVFSEFKNVGKIAEQKELADLGITQILFANGVRANLKKTDFAKDEIVVKISFGNGILDIPADKPEYSTAVYGLVTGGTKFQNISQISAASFLLKMALNVSVEGNSFVLSGGSTAKDFDKMIRLAATMFADAGFRAGGADQLKKYAQSFYLDYQTSPMAQLRYLPMRMISSPVAQIPGTFENFEKIDMAEIQKWLTPILKKSYMEISIVGDIDKSKTIELLTATFGATDARESVKKDPFAKLEMKPAGENFAMTYRTMDEPRSIAAVMWRSCGKQDVSQMRTANVLGSVLDDVLRKEVREKQGKVYSPFAYNSSSNWIANFGVMNAITAVIPSANAELVETLKKCGEKVAEEISVDAFERAKIPLVKSVEANKRKNEYWLSMVLNLSQAQPINIELARTIETGYASVTIEDVRAEAQKIFALKPYTASIMPNAAKGNLKK